MAKSKKTKASIVVHLQLFVGEILYDAKGNIKSENLTVKLTYNTAEWRNYMRQFVRNGFSKYKILKIIEVTDETRKTGEHNDVTDKMKGEIDAHIKEKTQVVKAPKSNEDPRLTELQKQNEQLMARLEALENGGNSYKKSEKPEKSEGDKLKARYKELYGKKPHHLMGEEKIKQAIEEKENESK